MNATTEPVRPKMPDPTRAAAAMLAKSGALITNSHFVYDAGEEECHHTDTHFDRYALSKDPAVVWRISRLLADKILIEHGEFGHIDAVVTPESGGIVFASWFAFSIGMMASILARPISSIVAKKHGRGFVFPFAVHETIRGAKCLVADDTVRTGRSISATARAVRKAGGEVLAAICLVNEGSVSAVTLNVPHFFALLNLSEQRFKKGQCLLCQSGVRVEKEFRKKRRG